MRPDHLDDQETARHLVYSYKDHGFVIDSREAANIFGDSVVASDTKVNSLASSLFRDLDLAGWICGHRYGREFSYIGGLKQGCMVWPKRT